MIKKYLKAAYKIAKLSPDPSTQLGAILLNKNGKIIGAGYNHFPEGVRYLPERLVSPLKYSFIEHAERDAIFNSIQNEYSPVGGTLYCPWFSCSDCAKAIVAAGIKKVIGHKQFFNNAPARWNESIAIGNTILDEAGVIREYYDGLIKGISVLVNGERWKC